MAPNQTVHTQRRPLVQARLLRRFPDSWLFGAAWMTAMLMMAGGAVRASDTPVRAVLKKAVPVQVQAVLRAPAR